MGGFLAPTLQMTSLCKLRLYAGCHTLHSRDLGNIRHTQCQKFKNSSDERDYKSDVRYRGINQRSMTLRWVCPGSYAKHPKNTYKAFKFKCQVHFLHSPAPPKALKVRQNRINRRKVIISSPDACIVAGCIFLGLACFSPSVILLTGRQDLPDSQQFRHISKSLSVHLPLPLSRRHPLPAASRAPCLVLLFFATQMALGLCRTQAAVLGISWER